MPKLRFGSVCSGIEAAGVAWHPLGWEAAWLSEIMPFPSDVLAHHYPDVPNLGDFTVLPAYVKAGVVESPDILVGGTPCQAFSVAGAGESLDDERGLLTLKFVELANAIKDVIIVWENVPGVLRTDDNAFGHYLGELAGSGGELFPSDAAKPANGKSSKFWGWSAKLEKHVPRWGNAGCVIGPKRAIAWRVLDAQYFGLAQRRKRVFLVASSRDGFDPSKILFESDGLRRDSAPSREARENIAPDAGTGAAGTGFRMLAFGQYADDETAGTMKARDYKDASDLVVGALDTECGYTSQTFQSVQAGHGVIHGSQDPITQIERAFPLGRNSGQENVILPLNTQVITRGRALGRGTGFGLGASSDPAYTLQEAHHHGVYARGAVRRLTPVECERLQGFPDDYTKVPYRNKLAEECPDGPRYAACGNSMPVSVMHWIGKRINDHLEGKL